MFEKLYFIHNPLNATKDWISEREMKIGSLKLKNVFGVSFLDDVRFMLQYNTPFKESVMSEYKLTNERNISLQHVCRLISKAELREMIDKEALENSLIESDITICPSFSTSVEFKDGYFFWNKETNSYDKVKNEVNDSRPLQEKF
jgi:hypothetical protein